MVHVAHLMILPPKKRDRDICLIRDKSAYYHQSNVPPLTAVCPPPWGPWGSFYTTGIWGRCHGQDTAKGGLNHRRFQRTCQEKFFAFPLSGWDGDVEGQSRERDKRSAHCTLSSETSSNKLIASAERDWSRWMVALWSLSSLRPWASSCRSPSCSWAPVGKDRFVEEEHDQTWFLFFWWASYSQTCLEHKCYQRIPENQYAQTFMGCYHVLFPDQPLSGLPILTSGSASRVAATLARFHQIWWDLGESKNAL